MIQINEGVSLKDFFGFEHYADTFRNFIFDICDIWTNDVIPNYWEKWSNREATKEGRSLKKM